MEQAGRESDRMREYREIVAHNKAITPEVTAEYIHELKQAYITVDREVFAIHQEIGVIDGESHSIRTRAEEIDERMQEINTYKSHVGELKTQRQKMGVFKSKKTIDSQIKIAERSFERADNSLRQKYHITPEEAPAEIKRLETKMHDLEQSKKPLQDRLPTMLADKQAFKLEYHKQKLLADIGRDRERILKRLEQLEAETRRNSQRKPLRGSVQTLDILTEKELQQIIKSVSPEQSKALMMHREQTIELAKIQELELTHTR
jgi:hypothetical protein